LLAVQVTGYRVDGVKIEITGNKKKIAKLNRHCS